MSCGSHNCHPCGRTIITPYTLSTGLEKDRTCLALRGCVKSPTIENAAKLYFDFIGQDLPGFKNLEGLTLQ